MEELADVEGGVRVTCDRCQYGCEPEMGNPIKKLTSFLTNSQELSRELNVRCLGRHGECSRDGGGTHQQCRGKAARLAAMYHFKLCRAILVGFRRQLQCDGVCKDGFIGMLDGRMENMETLPMLHIGDQVYKIAVDNGPIYRDDLTGQVLDPKLVAEARKKELELFEAKELWVRRSVEEARRRTGKPPVSVRWVDVNRGDGLNPNIRSRLVARQIRQPGEQAIFAPTPPHWSRYVPSSRSRRPTCQVGSRMFATQSRSTGPRYQRLISRERTSTPQWMRGRSLHT